MKALVKNKFVPGIIAYDKDKWVGWIAIQSRERYINLANSNILLPLDDKLVSSIVCFFVHKDYRKIGVSVKLIQNTCNFVAQKGGTIVGT